MPVSNEDLDQTDNSTAFNPELESRSTHNQPTRLVQLLPSILAGANVANKKRKYEINFPASAISNKTTKLFFFSNMLKRNPLVLHEESVTTDAMPTTLDKQDIRKLMHPRWALNMLVDKNLNYKLQALPGWRPLHIAAYYGHTSELKSLLLSSEIKFELGLKNPDGNNSLHLAALNRQFEATRLLLEHQVNINAKNQLGKTSLHLAVENNDFSIVKLLLTREANCLLTDEMGLTPLLLAQQLGHTRIIDELTFAELETSTNMRYNLL